MRWAILLAACAGCYQPSDVDCVASGACFGAGPDAPRDAYCVGEGTRLGRFCLASKPTGTPVFALEGNNIFNTDSCTHGATVVEGNNAACVMAGDHLIVPMMNARGARPLVLIGDTSVTIVGVIDAGSSRQGSTAAVPGPGVDPLSPRCAPADGPVMTFPGGAMAPGGAGGSYGGNGGSGGLVATNAAQPKPNDPVPADAAYYVPAVGCSGGKSAGVLGAGSPATGGLGGGLLLVISNGPITVMAAISSGGEGGSYGLDKAGGGGGGSGGFLGFDGTSYAFMAPLYATGGGGGGGNAGGAGTAQNGQDGSAGGGGAGGAGVSSGGMGGNGAGLATNDGDTPAMSNGSGGGGGGGAGVIVVYTSSALLISAAPTAHQFAR